MSEKILLVDDDANVLRAYQRALRRHFALDVAQGGSRALEMIASHGPYAVIVSDMRMPEMNGMELLRALRRAAPDTVRVMLTGNVDQQTAVDAVNEGRVFKFLNKPCSMETMADALREGIARYRAAVEGRDRLASSMAELADLSDKLTHQSRHDALTGLRNRQAFERDIRSFHESVGHQGGEHALCHLDLDHFHVVNDTCGHVAGDELLRRTASLLALQCRTADILGRLSSDEFGLLLVDCPLEKASAIARRIGDALRAMPFEWEGNLVEVSACIGIVPVTQAHQGVAALLSAAETACHVAKDRGRNVLHVSGPSDPEMTSRLNETQWLGRIQRALHEDHFRLFHQLIVPVGNSTEQGDHYELLIRMQDERGKLIPPGAFLPAAEHYYLSPELDRWVIRKAVEWLNAHPRPRERLALCSINLSGHSLGSREMLDFIRLTVGRSSIPPQKICFEVTETAAIAQLQSATRFIRDLRAEGFRFALDDFGSGLSSFAYLKNLPVDFLKIDGMFVKQIDVDEVDRAMVKSISEVARVLGKRTIAEFVENAESLRYLEALQVDYAQGYYLARPQPIDALDEDISTHGAPASTALPATGIEATEGHDAR